jgi:hypothetical protein
MNTRTENNIQNQGKTLAARKKACNEVITIYDHNRGKTGKLSINLIETIKF